MSTDLNRIRTRDDLSAFVADLARQAESSDLQWTNRDLPSFLEAMSAWIADMDGAFMNRGEEVPSNPSWKTIAQILSAATEYE